MHIRSIYVLYEYFVILHTTVGRQVLAGAAVVITISSSSLIAFSFKFCFYTI